jgi:tetratricopeptide (TPR) repeat protein
MIGVLTAYFKTTRVRSAAALYFLISGLLTQVPLFNYLGYEFSAVLTIPTAFISGILSILWMRDHRAAPLTRRTWLSVIGDYLLVNAILLVIPFTVISLNAFAVKNCAYGTGVMYFILLPVVTMVFSVSLALVIGSLFRKAIVITVAAVTAILSHIVLITVTQPQLFAYNFILGFFPGITYDETLTDITALVIYRQFTIVAALMLFSLFFVILRAVVPGDRFGNSLRNIQRSFRSDTMLWSIIGVCIVLLSIAHLYRHQMGFEHSATDIQSVLGRRSESSHFIMYYHSRGYSAEEMQRTKAEAEFHYRKLTDAMKLKENGQRKIEIFIYPNGEWKQRFIGTTNTNIAKPWKREIHLTAATFRTTFRHELVHILAAEFGIPLIRASTRMGLNEGLAVALDWDEGLFTPHHYAAGIVRMNGLEHAERLFTFTGFAAQSSTYAYLVSGSFIRYLLDRYGIERVRHVFPNGNFMGSFGESRESLIGDWKAFLKTVDDSELPPETVRSLFGQQSIFYKTCAREVADQHRKANVVLRSKRYGEAERIFRQAYGNAPTVNALRGMFQSLNAQQKHDEVLNIFAHLPEGASARTNPGVLLLAGDAQYLTMQYQQAAKLYQTVLSMNYSESFIEASAVRLQYLTDSIDANNFYALYYGGLSDSAKSLFVRNSLQKQVNSAALTYHRAVLSDNDSADVWNSPWLSSALPSLQYFALIRAAEQLSRQHRFEEAKSRLWQAKNLAPTRTVSDRLDEQIDLYDFIAMELQ